MIMIKPLRLLALSAAVLGLASCQNQQSNADPYASNAMGGGYNPYPDQGGYATNTAPSYAPPPSYQTPPAPEPATQSDPYAYTAPEPVKTTTSAPKKKTTTSSSKKKTSTASKRHTVKQGDTLYGIARSKGTTVAKLKSANGLSSDLIRPGQTLKIP